MHITSHNTQGGKTAYHSCMTGTYIQIQSPGNSKVLLPVKYMYIGTEQKTASHGWNKDGLTGP